MKKVLQFLKKSVHSKSCSKKMFFWVSVLFSASLNAQEGNKENWFGTLNAPNGEISMTLEITKKPLSGKLSTSSGILNMELEGLSFDGATLSFNIPQFLVSYKGKLSAEKISGIWKQGGQEAELIFFNKKPGTEKFLQKSVEPTDHEQQEVIIKQPIDGAILAGTLVVPKGPGPFPAVILLSVAGANDRDQTHSGGHKPFLVLANHLVKNGVASLRMDDRGVGESTGNLFTSDFDLLTKDALAAFSFLQSQNKINPGRIGYIGHSEGTVIASMAALENPKIAFVVMLGAVGAPLDVLIDDRMQRMQDMYRLSDVERTEIKKYHQSVNEILFRHGPYTEKKKSLELLKADKTFDNPDFQTHLFFLPKNKKERIELFLSPWYRSQIAYDPNSVLNELKCPTLIINGSLDMFQHPETNFGNIAKLLLDAGNKDFTLMVAPDINHVMQEAKTGFPTEYASLRNTFANMVLETVSHWLNIRF